MLQSQLFFALDYSNCPVKGCIIATEVVVLQNRTFVEWLKDK